MHSGHQSQACNGPPSAHGNARQQSEPPWAPCLPHGLYVRDGPGDRGGEPTQDAIPNGQLRKWSITGRNPDFWWDLVITQRHAETAVFELLCTRCGGGDLAASICDLLRLIRNGAHLHDTDPDVEHA